MKEFGERLKKIMVEKGVTGLELSQRLEVTSSTIINYTTGKRFPGYYCLRKLAQVLGVSADYMLGLRESDGGNARTGFIPDDSLSELVSLAQECARKPETAEVGEKLYRLALQKKEGLEREKLLPLAALAMFFSDHESCYELLGIYKKKVSKVA
jgi:transcriptional regulator with XRE-family HTH domain